MSKKFSKLIESTKPICSFCKKDIRWEGNRYDEIFYKKTGKCYDCVVEEETQMRIKGVFDIYEKIKIIRNQQSFLEDMRQKLTESLTWLKNDNNKIQYVNGDGSLEDWDGPSKEEFLTGINKDLQETNEALDRCKESIKTLENEYTQRKTNLAANS